MYAYAGFWTTVPNAEISGESINSASDIPAEPIVRVPDISTLPFMSTVVAAICISVSATKSNCPSVDEYMYNPVS